jgi:GH35 family endo-1,4-beta-xylanase
MPEVADKRISRRNYLKAIGVAAAGAATGVAATYYGLTTRFSPPTQTATQTVTATVTEALSCAVSLRAVAENRGLLIGAGASSFYMVSPKDLDLYTNTLAREFNYLTPENDMKWPYIHFTADSWDFAPADKIVSFASDHQMKVRGGPIIWSKDQYGLPSLEMIPMKEMTTDDFRQVVHEHISSLVGHYKGKIHDWEVLAEAVDDQGELREGLFLEKLGEGYIGEVFEVVHEADPDALLIYSDYGAEALGRKSDGVYSLVKGLLADGVPIHGVGLQMHIGMDPAGYPKPEDIAQNIRRLADLGLRVGISEMDVQIKHLPGSLQERLETQRKIYHDVIAACLKERNFTDITFWNFTDKYSWIDLFFGADDPLLFDEEFQPKPAYWGVLDALLGK